MDHSAWTLCCTYSVVLRRRRYHDNRFLPPHRLTAQTTVSLCTANASSITLYNGFVVETQRYNEHFGVVNGTIKCWTPLSFIDFRQLTGAKVPIGPWLIRSLKLLFPGTVDGPLAPWNIRSQELLLPGTNVLGNFRSLELWLLWCVSNRLLGVFCHFATKKLCAGARNRL